MDFHSMKRKKLQALCKKHSIPANLTNSEMANRLTSLLKGDEDKLLGENGCELESGVENKPVKKVRFSPETETFEFQKSEVKYVTRSRARRFAGKYDAAAKKKEDEGGHKNNEASGSILPSDVENKDRVIVRKSLRRREVVGEGKSRNEDTAKGLEEEGRDRHPRQGKDKPRDNADGGGERDAEFMEFGVEKVFERTERNATKVADYKLTSSGTVAAGSSVKPVNREATEAVEEKEKTPVVLNLRRSRRNVCTNNEPLLTLDDLVANVNLERKKKKQKKDLVEEQETVLVDSINIELPLASLPRNVNSSERDVGKVAQKAERESEKQTVEIEDSLCKDLTNEELPDVDVQPSMVEVTEGTIARDSENKSFTDNLKKPERRSGRKSPHRAQDSSKGVNMKYTASESTELDNIQTGVGTSHGQPNEIDQLESTDSRGIQVWIELSVGMGTMSRPASLDHLVEDERISNVSSQEYLKHQGFESVSGDVLEGDEIASLNGLCGRVSSTSSMKGKTPEVNLACFKDAAPNYNGDYSSTFNSGRALDCLDLSQTMLTNNAEIVGVSRHRNVDQGQQKCTNSGKSLKEKYDTTVTRMLGDENDDGGENPEQSAGLEMKHLEVPATDDNVTDASCSRIDYDPLISSSDTIEIVLELNSASDNPERSINVMDYKPLEPRNQSPNIQWRDVGLNDATEVRRHFADAEISAKLPELDEKRNIADQNLESNLFDSSEYKLNMSGDIDANVGKGIDGDVDLEKPNLAMEVFAADTIDESNETYENQPDKYVDADLIESCIQEAEKVDNNFGEMASSKDSMRTAVSTITMKVDITLEQKRQSAILNMCVSEADKVAEEDIAHDQLDLKNCSELDRCAEDRNSDKPLQSHNLVSEFSASDPCKRSTRRMLEIDALNTCDSSKGNTANLEGKEEGGSCLVGLCLGDNILPAENAKYEENPANSEDVTLTTKYRTSICPHVSVEHNYDKSSAVMNLGLERREQSAVVQGKGGEVGSVVEVNGKYDPEELKCAEQDRSPNECRTSSILDSSRRSGRRILLVEIGNEESLGLQKNNSSFEKSYEVQPNKEEKFSFFHSCMREECTYAGGDINYKENPRNFSHAMAVMKTGRSQCVSVLFNNVDASSTMNLNATSGQRVHSLAMDRNGCEADSVAGVDVNYDKEDFKSDELSKKFEDELSDDKCHFPRSILKDSADSTECQKSLKTSRKTFKDESTSFLDFHEISKCNSVIEENSEELPIYFEGPTGAIQSASEHTASQISDMAMDQWEETSALQIDDCCANNVTEGHENPDKLELYCDEATESVDDRCMEEHHHLPKQCLVSKVSYSRRSASRMLQAEIVGCSEDSLKCDEHYKVEPEKDGTACPNESFVMGRYTWTSNYEEDNPENCKDAMKETTRTVKFACIPMIDKNGDHISTKNLEKSEQSLAMQENGCETDTVAGNKNHEHHESNCDESAKLVEGRPSEEHCNSPDKCQMLSLSHPSRRILENKITSVGKDFNKTDPFLGTSMLNPSLVSKELDRNCSTMEFSSSISDFGITDPFDCNPVLGPEIKEVSADCNKIEHSTSPDASAHEQENIKDAMNDVADALGTSEVKNCLEIASFQRGKQNEVVVVEAGDSSPEGIPSPLSDNDAQGQVFTAGDEISAENGTKEDSYEIISEKISDFVSSQQLSEANINAHNIQEDFSCKDQEDNGEVNKDNLTSIFSQVQFATSEIHDEDRIVNIVDDDVSSNLSYKNHEILKESDVADTINEYIESESTMDASSLRIDGTIDTLKVRVFTKVPDPEDDRVAVEEKGAADLEETAPRGAKVSDSKPTRKNSDIAADNNIVLGKQLTYEMWEEDMRVNLVHETCRKLQMAADVKENLPHFKIERVASLTTPKPTTKRTALHDVFIQK